MTLVRLRLETLASLALVATVLSGCAWGGLNSLTLPGTEGGGAGAFEIQAELPDVATLQENSRVRVGDVNVGTVTKIERQDWHALITMSLNGDVEIPANAVATVGQTSLLGSAHVELAAPGDVAPEGRLRGGSLIRLASGGEYPSTEQTLAALSLLLNGGGLGQVQDITEALGTAFAGREADLRSVIDQLDEVMGRLNAQTGDIIAASESLNGLAGRFAASKPVLDNALRTVPDALNVLAEQRTNLADALDAFGKFSALTADTINQSKDNLVTELKDLGPVLKSLGDAGPALTRALSLLATFPWPKETLPNWMRGDYANLTTVVDLTLSRIDSALFTGTRWEGDLTKLELQWGRTIGQTPSPYTAGNPLIIPYHLDQGP
jgi:phospholipid/cholesterol/gamma-HCH transport system substrate-binding protein